MSETVQVFAALDGAVVYIGGYGRATFHEGVAVPQAVAEEFTGRADLRVGEVAAPVAASFRTHGADEPEPAAEAVMLTTPPREGRKDGK